MAAVRQHISPRVGNQPYQLLRKVERRHCIIASADRERGRAHPLQLIPPVIIALAFQRYLVRGMLSGSLKG